MPTKITEAINQLNHSIDSLGDAVPLLRDTINTKQSQIADLQEEYLKVHTAAITGYWDIDFDSTNDYKHVHLTGWQYDCDESSGNANGNALVAAIGKAYLNMPLTVALPTTNYTQAECYAYPPSATIRFHDGYITLDFYFFTQINFFHFIKEHNIILETRQIDAKIDGFSTRLDELIEVRKSIATAMGTPTFIGCTAGGTEHNGFLCPHPPIYYTDAHVEVESPIQFNVEEVSALHKHVGITYEHLTKIITQLHDNPEDTAVVRDMTNALFNVQGELDNIAVEVGDLDTNDEPTDVGMAGCTYWNLLQAAQVQLDSTIDYISEQDFPAFPEVRHRLGKLDTMLYNCCKEFEDNWLKPRL